MNLHCNMVASGRRCLMLGFRLRLIWVFVDFNWNFVLKLSSVSKLEYNARTDPKDKVTHSATSYYSRTGAAICGLLLSLGIKIMSAICMLNLWTGLLFNKLQQPEQIATLHLSSVATDGYVIVNLLMAFLWWMWNRVTFRLTCLVYSDIQKWRWTRLTYYRCWAVWRESCRPEILQLLHYGLVS